MYKIYRNLKRLALPLVVILALTTTMPIHNPLSIRPMKEVRFNQEPDVKPVIEAVVRDVVGSAPPQVRTHTVSEKMERLREIVEETHMKPLPEPEVVQPELPLTEEEIRLIAVVTMAEAEAEPVEGKRLVIDTILNRKDSGYFPNTISEVIYQPDQFTCMWNGRINECYVREDLYNLVIEELYSRYNSSVVFFRTRRFSDYGVPMFQVGHHYFSSYN